MVYLYLIIALILTLTIAFNVRTFRCFCKSGFVKTITSVMGISITIIGIFVGIFADNLSQHNKTDSNRFWFSPRNIIEFPIKELKHHTIQTDALDSLFENQEEYNSIFKDVVDTLTPVRTFC